MSRTGAPAAITLAAEGVSASDLNQGLDLAVAESGPTLSTDPDGDPLAVAIGLLWLGVTASEVA